MHLPYYPQARQSLVYSIAVTAYEGLVIIFAILLPEATNDKPLLKEGTCVTTVVT